MSKIKRNIYLFALIGIVLLGLFIWDFFTGHIKIPFNELFLYLNPFSESSEEYYLIIREFRLPRVLISVLSGAALSVSGLLMQTMFRNPLAGPYVLGISSGASLGVALMVLGTGTVFSGQLSIVSGVAVVISAAIGAALIMFLIVAVSMRISDILSILIIGILIAGIVGAIVNLLQFFAEDVNVKSFVVWTMGSLSAVSFNDIKLLSPIVIIVLSAGFLLSKYLNIMLLGDDFAVSMGISLKVMRVVVFTAVSLLAGSVTAFCGPLGFIGIAVPHVARWIFNCSNHFILIPACILIGACFMLTGDLLTHLIPKQGVLPVNAVTAIIGAPFVVWIVIKNKRTVI